MSSSPVYGAGRAEIVNDENEVQRLLELRAVREAETNHNDFVEWMYVTYDLSDLTGVTAALISGTDLSKAMAAKFAKKVRDEYVEHRTHTADVVERHNLQMGYTS